MEFLRRARRLQKPAPKCPLLDRLPPEIRIMIYRYALQFAVPMRKVTKKNETALWQKLRITSSIWRKRAGILFTCKTIYIEAAPVFIQLNTLSLKYDEYKVVENVGRAIPAALTSVILTPSYSVVWELYSGGSKWVEVLERIVTNAPCLEKVIMACDFFDEPVGKTTMTRGLGDARCYSACRYRLVDNPKIEFAYVSLVRVWSQIVRCAKKGFYRAKGVGLRDRQLIGYAALALHPLLRHNSAILEDNAFLDPTLYYINEACKIGMRTTQQIEYEEEMDGSKYI